MTMLNSKEAFHQNIKQANELGRLYDLLRYTAPILEQLSDLLRSQIVYSVSAFDKLMHDLIRIGMVEIFENQRAATSKYLNEAVAIEHLPGLSAGAVPPPPVRFEEIVREKLSKLSFQEPTKIADGLTYVWNEQQKWQKIASGINMSSDDAKRKLRLIATRRNAIVHEADLDPVTNGKQTITQAEARDTSDFLLRVGNEIFDLIVLPPRIVKIIGEPQ